MVRRHQARDRASLGSAGALGRSHVSGVGAAPAAPLIGSAGPGPEAPGTSLVSSGRLERTPGTGGWRGGWDYCPRRERVRGFDEETGALFRTTCGANTCPYCIETNVWLWGLALEHAAPERYAVFTGLSGDWQRDRATIKALLRELRRLGYEVHEAHSIEVNPKGTGFHMNLWWHGSYVPQSVLSEVAVKVGLKPYVHVTKWQSRRRDYGMKEASGRDYGMKEASGRGQEVGERSWVLNDRQASYLARNGGALMHASRGFWRDGKGGAPLGTRRATLDAYRRSQGQERQARKSWVMYAGSELLAHVAVSPSSPASGTSTEPPGSPSTAPPNPPGSRPDGVPSDQAEGLTLHSSPVVTLTCSRSGPTALSTDPVSLWTQESLALTAGNCGTGKPPPNG